MKKMILILSVVTAFLFPLGAEQKVTDMAGRFVTLPDSISKIVTANSVSSIFLYTLDPALMSGWNLKLNKKAVAVLDKKAVKLPYIGVLYGNGKSANDEEILSINPDFILVMGEINKAIINRADELENHLKIPCLVLDSSLEKTAEAYFLLGKVTGRESRAEELGVYCADILVRAKTIADSIPEEERKRIFYSLGKNGLNSYPAGNLNAGLIELCGAVNVVNLEYNKKFGPMAVGFEQLLIWNPDIVLGAYMGGTAGSRKGVYDTQKWKSLDAEIAIVPWIPFNFFEKPPSVNRFSGIMWLQSILYPEYIDYDPDVEISRLFKLLGFGQYKP